MYKKLYTLYKEGAIFFCYFLISRQSVFLCEGLFFFSSFFSESRVAEVSEAPQVLSKKKKHNFFLGPTLSLSAAVAVAMTLLSSTATYKGLKQTKKSGDWSCEV